MKLNLILIVVILISCTPKMDVDSNSIRLESDTLDINHHIFVLDSIPKAVFYSAKQQSSIEVKGEQIDDTARVSRDSLKLLFNLANGSNLVLMDDTTEGYSNFVEYEYLSSLEFVNYWLLRIFYYEGGGYVLIDKENGEKIAIYGEPKFSPNNQFFICSSWDLEAAYDPNGLQLYEIKNKKAKQRWSVDISDWGPSEVRWKNDSLVYIEQIRVDLNNSPDGYSKSYKSMFIK